MIEVNKKWCAAWSATIYLSAPVAAVEQICRAFCMRGLCVTVTPTNFIFTGGEQAGVAVGLINYPRFPSEIDELEEATLSLALKLLEATYQRSLTVVQPNGSYWMERKDMAPR